MVFINFMAIYKKNINRLLLFLPLALCGALIIFKKYIFGLFELSHALPGCTFHLIFKKSCPGCGGTRSFLALINGDILLSLRYNALPLFFLILGILFYIEAIARAFGKRIVIVPRSNAFIYCSIAVFLIYFVVRNFIPELNPDFIPSVIIK